MFSSWLRNLPAAIGRRPAAIGIGSRKPKGVGRKSACFRPRIEALDDRVVPAQVNLTVKSLADSGSGSLRDAILTADGGKTSDKFTINVAVSGKIDLQSPLPDLNNSIAIEGPGASSLTIERAAGYSFSSAIVTVDAGQSASLTGLTIANGDAGGIFNNGGTLTVANCAIINNVVFHNVFGLYGEGGGIDNFGGTLTVSGSTVSGNTASFGGGIFSFGTLTVSGSTVSDNVAPGVEEDHVHVAGSGGGIIGQGVVTLSNSTIARNSTDGAGGGFQGDGSISGCTISDNAAFWGGGIDEQGFMTISSSTLSGNTAHGSRGGGMLIEGPTTVSGCTFTRNSAIGVDEFGHHFPGSGGAIYVEWPSVTVRDSSFNCNSAELGGAILNPGGLTVIGCAFTGNSAIDGGGIYSLGSPYSGTLDVRGSTFTGNTASDSGGAVYNLGTATLQECTLSGNSATDGGGIFNAPTGTLSVKDSTVLGNFALLGADLYNAGEVSVSDSIIGVRYDV